MFHGKQNQRRQNMEIMRIKDIMRKPEQDKWSKIVGQKVLNSFIVRENGQYVYSAKGESYVSVQFLNAAGLKPKYTYTLIDGFSEDVDDLGLYTDTNGTSIVPVEIKYRSKRGNYQLNTHQLAVPGIIHLLYDDSFERVREYTFEELAGSAGWRICNQLQFNPDVPGKTLREVFLDMHSDITRVERLLVEKEKDERSWMYSMAKSFADVIVGEKKATS